MHGDQFGPQHAPMETMAEPGRPSETHVTITALEEAVERLCSVVGNVEPTFAGVLRPPSPEAVPPDQGKTELPSSAVARRIAEQLPYIDHATQQLAEIMRRAEV